MNSRIERLQRNVLDHDINPRPTAVEYDPFDEELPEPMRIGKRLADYIEAQPASFTPDNRLVGTMKFDGTVESDIFPRIGHRNFYKAVDRYYKKPIDNLCSFEWQHSNPDYGKLLRLGLEGISAAIEKAKPVYRAQPDRLAFLAGLELVIHGIERRAEKCAGACLSEARRCTDPQRADGLRRMAANCGQVPRRPARDFEEAVQCVYFCFPFLSDSIGRPDQYLLPFYREGLAKGTLTRDHAKELLQELFVMIHGWTPPSSSNADFGAESHFAIGGYTVDRECAYNDLSELILESLMELDLIRPEISFRWNEKTPRELLRRVMDAERHDKNKRIAFVNDEPRIAALQDQFGLPWEVAYDYIMVGCNEQALQGGINLAGNKINVAKSIETLFHDHPEDLLACRTFDDFYRLYEAGLYRDLTKAADITNRFNAIRAKDCNVLSSLFLEGCIENAQSATRGGASLATPSFSLIGGTTVIDSLAIVRQFVFEEKRVSMEALVEALRANWEGHEELRAEILRNGRFFGNADPLSDELAQRFDTSLWAFTQGRTDLFGNKISYGNLTGYHPYFRYFGKKTRATPDGRHDGDDISFGSGQAGGKDRDGLTSLLLSVAHMDPKHILTGSSVLNVMLPEKAFQDDAEFEKVVSAVEIYFREGGSHVQFTHASKAELVDAKAHPESHQSLRVRVSGFSAQFVSLQESHQDNIIERTEES